MFPVSRIARRKLLDLKNLVRQLGRCCRGVHRVHSEVLFFLLSTGNSLESCRKPLYCRKLLILQLQLSSSFRKRKCVSFPKPLPVGREEQSVHLHAGPGYGQFLRSAPCAKQHFSSDLKEVICLFWLTVSSVIREWAEPEALCVMYVS